MGEGFDPEYNPTVEEIYQKTYNYKHVTYNLTIFDVLSIDEFNNLIDNLIQQSDIFIIVFSLTKLSSFEKVTKIRNRIYSVKDCSGASKLPIVVVGELRRKQSGFKNRETGCKTTDW